MKRFIDLLISIMGLLIFSPILIIVAIIVKIGLGSPIIFKQERPGLYGKPFFIYKFRTMTDKKDENGNLLSNELRLTKLGLFLRKYSIDELPQFFNVIKGDLSIIGPRPLLMKYLPLYTEEQFRRHDVKPGITGWAQVNGRNSISWEEKFALDVWYVDHQSLSLDIKILFLTIKKVIKKEGVSAVSQYIMDDFAG